MKIDDSSKQMRLKSHKIPGISRIQGTQGILRNPTNSKNIRNTKDPKHPRIEVTWTSFFEIYFMPEIIYFLGIS
jgi:hypothetical protein